MNNLFKLILSMSLSGSVLALLLFAVAPFIKEYFYKSWQYYIWIIVILRLLIPYSPDISLMGNLFDRAETAALQQIVSSIPTVSDAEIEENKDAQVYLHIPEKKAISQQLKEEAYDHMKYIWSIWILGAFLTFIFRVLQYRSFIHCIRVSSYIVENEEVSGLFRQAANELSIKRNIPLYQSRLIKSPMLIGLTKPAIIIPENFLNTDSLCYVFKHELIHYKRHDIWYKWLLQLTVCIHWFNPLVYIMSRRINRLCEFSCDEAVTKRLNTTEKKEYCSTIINAVSFGSIGSANIISVTLCDEKKYLKERMSSIMRWEKKSKRIIILSTTFAVVLCCMAVFLGIVSTEGYGEKPSKDSDVNNNAALDTLRNLPANGEDTPRIVIIDPGHGGTDTGALYNDNNEGNNIEIIEKEQNLKIALLLRDMLEESGVDVDLTRQDDKEATLEERMKLAKDSGASLFVSIHLNASSDRAKKGTLIMYNSLDNDKEYGMTGKKAAQLMHYKLADKIGTEDAGVIEMSKGLKYSNLKMPALTVELAFMTNMSDRRIIMSEGYESEAAKALHEGILSVLKHM